MKMETVFIDTSVIVANKYFHPNSLVMVLGDLASKGHIRILLPEITVEEIRINFDKDFREALSSIAKNSSMYRNYDESFCAISDKNRENIVSKAKDKVESFLTLPNVMILPYDTNCDISSVFGKYFKGEPPFDKKDKKKEFPDAFVLNALEKYAKENGIKIICISQDGDFKTYNSKYLIKTELRNFITLKQKEIEEKMLKIFDNIIGQHKDEILKQAKDITCEHLDNVELYNNNGETEITNITINNVTLSSDLTDYTIIRESENEIDFSLQVKINCAIDIYYLDYSAAYYDKEDDFWLGVEYDNYSLEKSSYIYVILTVDKDNLLLSQLDWELNDIDFSELDDDIDGSSYYDIY